ncbi:MAG: hypothetical protein H0X65_17890 [Gemmatimonadetes bacterium]|nr:hypothetical protein [Gemmatimonadota bacterium]
MRGGVPGHLASCHTAVANGYVIEEHVPADVVRRLALLPIGRSASAGFHPAHRAAPAPPAALRSALPPLRGSPPP